MEIVDLIFSSNGNIERMSIYYYGEMGMHSVINVEVSYQNSKSNQIVLERQAIK